ncbi:hypothetical protein ANCCAN_02013 [Ancylostoma caninum]|uniref:7TM GPCR serpentine receptor class x (Srx) domain-containing protein n=1 Tax=Ancylostoma caninum TaxID=29170 RepID=A0A368H9K1_ANCCA|nr:hypothetical protein ANCCAN_02013 [Ancylostoma caninum]
MLILDLDPGDEALTISADLRDTSMYAAGLHMLLLSAERQLATIRSGTYENESHIPHICAAIVSIWLFSYFVVTTLREHLFTNFLAAFIFLTIYGISILIMMHVRRTNFIKWKKHRGTLMFSQSFQVRENVTSARYLYTCFVVFSVQTLIGWICLVLYLVFKRVLHVPILEKVFGFVFDILLASQTTSIPLVIFFNNAQLKAQLRRILSACCSLASHHTNYIIDLEGRNMKVSSKDETKTYFDQLKEAWS